MYNAVIVMMLGHALLAFTVVTVTAAAFGYSRHYALVLGGIAGIYAFLPDVDILYATVGLLQVSRLAFSGIADSFWMTSAITHRGITHSLLVSIIGAAGFTAVYRGRRYRYGGIILLGGMVAGGYMLGGGITTLNTVLFAAVGAAVAALAARHTPIPVTAFGGAALFGLVSHPFGDVFTGTPPAFLYPMDVILLSDRIVLLADPTLNLLTLFAIELVIAWAALGTASVFLDQPLATHLHPIAGIGLLYTAAAILLPAPTLAVSYHFVVSVIGIGVLVTTVLFHRETGLTPISHPEEGTTIMHLGRCIDTGNAFTLLTTLLATITVAFTAYTAMYILISI